MIMPVSVSCTLLPRCSCSAIAIAAYTSLFFIINIVYSAPPQSGEGAKDYERKVYEKAVSALAPLKGDTSLLREFAEYIVTRGY